MMWPIPKLEQNSVIFLLSPDKIVAGWIDKNKDDSFIEFKGYQTYSLENTILNNSFVFNPTAIKNIINDFLIQYKKQNAFISFILSHQYIVEKYVAVPISHPTLIDLGITRSANFLWGYQFMYHNDIGQSVFYVYKISRLLLLQYQLIAMCSRINLTTITTEQISFFGTYKCLAKHLFRQSQYALDMVKYDNAIQKAISIDALSQSIVIPSGIVIEDEFLSLAALCGLYYLAGLPL